VKKQRNLSRREEELYSIDNNYKNNNIQAVLLKVLPFKF
jgi:hypothetical protein